MTPEEYNKINMLPSRDNPHVKRVISLLNIEVPPVYVDIRPDGNAEAGQCFLNVLGKVKHNNGEMAVGWRFCEYSYMIEAEFHAVWQSPEGMLLDITPNELSSEEKILFVIDRNKKYEGVRTDNFRFNITGNELVEDIIEIEKANFRYIDKAQHTGINGEVIMNEDEIEQWQTLSEYSFLIENIFTFDGTTKSNCFCGSLKQYENCHRKLLYEFLRSI